MGSAVARKYKSLEYKAIGCQRHGNNGKISSSGLSVGEHKQL
jgi:hypothetical protein